MNKNITNIKYNHLNQPTEIDFGTKNTKYIYTATGVKLQTKIYEEGKLKSKTDYSGAFVYENDKLSYTNIQGGRIINNKSSINNYQYYLTDHLGNVRVTFTKGANGNAEIIQEDHYYPFGMRMSGQHYSNTDLINKYLYNGKEQQDQTNYYDYGFRQFDAQLGRWHVIDAMSEKYFSTSPYAYVLNNPISSIDVMGLYKKPQYEHYDRGEYFSWNMSGLMHFAGPTGADYDAWIAMGGGGEGSSFSAWYGFGGRAGMSLDDYFAPYIGLSYDAVNNSLSIGPGYKNLFKNNGIDKSLTASINGPGEKPKPNWAIIMLAKLLRNSQSIGGFPNPFYLAEAIAGDIGGLTFAGEGDIGYVLILAGEDIGKLISYKELTDVSVVFVMSVGIEFSRIDFEGNNNDFKSSYIYGKRHKLMLDVGLSPETLGFGVGISYSWSKAGGTGLHVYSTAFSLSWGISPSPIIPGYNHGTISRINP